MIITGKRETYDGSWRVVNYATETGGKLTPLLETSFADAEIPLYFEQQALSFARLQKRLLAGEISPIGFYVDLTRMNIEDLAARMRLRRSTVRAQCLPDLSPLYAGYVAWRALISESDFPPDIHRELFNYMSFCLPPGEQFLGYPVTGADEDLRAGNRRFNVVWYRPADEKTKLPWLLTDERGVTHQISIPPPLIRREAIAEMRADAERLVAPQLLAVARLIGDQILQPIYDLESPRMAFGRVAIVGDAAFVARPHVAAGVAKAADDAAALVAALAAEPDVPAALKRFEAERLPVGRRIIERARHLGAYLQAIKTAEERARSERHSNAQAVLSETAVLDFLYA
jgi:2-polyprenyl-6-methoxyphenol hydroxylase-like FAD-dependent oxidoreductase